MNFEICIYTLHINNTKKEMFDFILENCFVAVTTLKNATRLEIRSKKKHFTLITIGSPLEQKLLILCR